MKLNNTPNKKGGLKNLTDKEFLNLCHEVIKNYNPSLL